MRRWLVPETVQSSAMDCGPAALKSLLEGHGISVSYGRLREACQTDVDGTSIDALEEAAIELGLAAEQIMVPADHVLLPQAHLLPALAVVRLPNNIAHFVIVWRRAGKWVQVMDPASGRRWVSAKALTDEFYRHVHSVPADAWLTFTNSDSFRDSLAARLRRLGIRGTNIPESEDWQAIGSFDAAVRMVEALAASGAIRRGARLARVVSDFAAKPDMIPAGYWSARPDPGNSGNVFFKAAVLIHVSGRSEDAAKPRSVELKAALNEPPARPGFTLLRMILRDSAIAPIIALAALAVAAAAVVFEAILFRSVFDLSRDLRISGQRWWAAGSLSALIAAVLLLETHLATLLTKMGRKLELRLRAAFLRKLPLLGDRYFQSRLTSDMAERGHVLHALRDVPRLAAEFLRPVFEMILTIAAIAWLYPWVFLPAAVAGLAAIGIPLLAQPWLAVLDSRLRTHSGALLRFTLDSLLGWAAIRSHGAESKMRQQHSSLLGEWAAAGLELHFGIALLEGAQLLITLGCAALMLFSQAAAGGGAGSMLLLLYWTMRLPALGQEAAAVAWQYPGKRNVAIRLLEPLGTPEEPVAAARAERSARASSSGVTLDLEDVTVRAAGQTILSAVNLSIAAGEHVGIVGPSGAGKSTLIGLMLGWHRAAEGRMLADGVTLEPNSLRREIAWVDPQVQLWNSSLLNNIRYGSDATDIESAVNGADLRQVVARLPDGMESRLGEGGAIVSGGEGQRVRLARALLRSNVRLVLLDEPARGLERSRRRHLLRCARETWTEQTLLAVTHDVSDTLDLPRVIVIEQGRIVEDGNPRHLAADPYSRYRALLDAETSVRRGLWSSERWRRVRFADGTLTEAESTFEETRSEAVWTLS